MTNFVFISPDFPQINLFFCEHLAQTGVRVLGVGDADYDGLNPRLKTALTEYYKVSTLESYDEVFRAIAFLSFKYGKIDVLESNNAYWLAQDAKLRTDFNITSGPLAPGGSDSDLLDQLNAAGLPTGEPAGQVISWEGLLGADGEILFEGSTKWPSTSAADYTYRTLSPIPHEVEDLGHRVVQVLDAKLTFLHVQVSYRDEGKPHIIRVSRSAAPAFTLDMHNFAQGIDVYERYAAEVADTDPHLTRPKVPAGTTAGTQICVYASRHDNAEYQIPALDLEAHWKDQIVFVDRNPEQYRQGMGDTYYLAVVEDSTEGDRFAHDVTSRPTNSTHE